MSNSGRNGNSWPTVRLGDVIASMKNGIYKPRSSYFADGVACLRMYNIDAGRIVWKDIKRMRLSDDEVEEYGLQPGDLLVNRVNSRELVGKAAVIPNGLEPCVFESKNIRVRLRTDIADPRFVSFALLINGQSHFNRNAQQVVGMASISQPQVAAFKLSLPPLDEQQRIVAEIEKQFTRLDAGVASLKQVQVALKRYRASVLKAACDGDWPQATLESLSVASSYGTSMKCSYKGSSIPVLRIPNIQNGRIDLTDLKFANSHGDLDDQDALKPNDFLIVRTNGSKDLIGRGAVVLSKFERPHFFASYLIRFRIRDGVAAKWVSTVWDSECVREQILKMAATSAGQYNVNQTNLARISLPLPPVAERTRIVAKVEERFRVIDRTQSLVGENVQRAAGLRRAILQQMFSRAA